MCVQGRLLSHRFLSDKQANVFLSSFLQKIVAKFVILLTM